MVCVDPFSFIIFFYAFIIHCSFVANSLHELIWQCVEGQQYFQRREFQLYKFPLVWAEPLQRDNRHFVRIYTPEDELHVEFNEAAAKVASLFFSIP